jgi:hypothetical protein
VTENVSVGIGTLAALLERLAYNIMLVKNIFKARVYLKEISNLMYSGSSIYKFIFWSNGSNKPRDAGTLN